jgi:membrane protein YqaA with SNARE-associated domain
MSAGVGAVTVLGALGTGFASALVPVVNAEAAALLAAATVPRPVLVLTVLALAVGQTAGKLVLFESARRGGRTSWARHVRSARAVRWAARVRRYLTAPRLGPLLVLAAAAVGLPPLAVVALAAGAAGQNRAVFAAVCLLGRFLRFAAVAASVAWTIN